MMGSSSYLIGQQSHAQSPNHPSKKAKHPNDCTAHKGGKQVYANDFDKAFEVPLKHVKDTVELVSGGITLIDGRSNARNNKKDPIEQSHDVRKQRRRGTKVHIDIGIAAVELQGPRSKEEEIVEHHPQDDPAKLGDKRTPPTRKALAQIDVLLLGRTFGYILLKNRMLSK